MRVDWFGLNWTDILLGTALLAIVPFAYSAYGVHLATEAIADPKRRLRIKLLMWVLFVIGVGLGFWQQLRAAEADLDKGTKEIWAAALLTQELRQPHLLPPVPCELKTLQPKARPDIAMALLYPEAFSVEILNKSNALLKSPKIWFAIWNLDQSDANGHAVVLPIPTFTGDWIRAHEGMGPEGVFSLPQINSSVKKGDRILGFIGVTCPDCVRTRGYLVYAVQGQGGWYAELPSMPDFTSFLKIVPQIRQNPEAFLKDIPDSSRVPIANTLQDVHR
jgi:hypothetical protein